MWKFTKTVALEQHMDNITVAVAVPGRQPPEFCDDVPSTPEAVRKLMGRLDDGKMDLRFCYEAGPCGYGLYRQLTMMDYDCSVVAPSLSPRRPGNDAQGSPARDPTPPYGPEESWRMCRAAGAS